MKKLMKTVAASAVALVASGAFADLPSPSAPLSFDALTTSNKYTVSEFVSMDDSGDTEGSKYWFAITNDAQQLDAELATISNDSDTHGNYLTIEAGAPLYRTINAASDQYGASFDVAGATAETIGANGIYLDTMVKFTVSSEDTFADVDSANDKLAITCYSEDDSDKTNILVRAGYVVGSTATPTNYYLSLPSGNFDIGAWHRLTVRAIADVGYPSAPVGFAIYLDGTLLTYDTTVDRDAAPGDSTYVGSLNAAVTQNLYNSETHALLPSLIDSTSDSCGNLSAVGFKGSGSIDDIQFLGTRPEGLPTEGISVTVGWDAGVATYTVVDSNDKTLVDAASTSGAVSTNLTLDAGVTYLTVTATYATGYEAGTWTKTAGTLSNGVWTFSENGATLTIVSMEPKFEVNGVHYGSFEDALGAAAGTDEASMGTIKLLADVTGDNEVSGWVTIDLAGKTLTGVTDGAIINDGAHLFITNSTVEIGRVQTGTAKQAVNLTGGYTTIYAGWFDGEILDDGADDLSLYGGSYLDEEHTAPEDFYLYTYAQDTVTYTGSDHYFQVGGAEPAPTTYALTLPTGVNATATVTAGGVEVVDIAAIEAGTEVVVTWTANADYKITDGATENITMSENKTAATPIVVAIDYATLTIDTVANCSIVVSNATEEVATGAKFDKDDNVQLTVYRTPAEGYELDGYAATENITMTENQTVTAAVKQSGGSYPSYIPDDPEVKAKYDTWAKYAGVTPAEAADLEEAYILNCLPAEVAAAKAAFKFTSISYDATKGEWATETTTSYNGREYNGEVVVKRYSDVTCTTESVTGTFFRAVLQ